MNSSVNLAKRSLAVWLAIVLAIGLSFSSWAANGFRYQHDPRENPAAMRDIAEDENAVYGFRPSETGSLKLYADADWSDPAVVEQGRQDRIAYHESIASMYVLLEEMEAQGCSVEEIARAVSTRRNEIRLEAYADDPEALAALKARNLEKYGHEEGPLPDELYAQYGLQPQRGHGRLPRSVRRLLFPVRRAGRRSGRSAGTGRFPGNGGA